MEDRNRRMEILFPDDLQVKMNPLEVTVGWVVKVCYHKGY